MRLTRLRRMLNVEQVAPVAANATSVACVAPRSQYMGGVALSLSLDGGATVLAPEASYVYAHPAVVSSMLPADGPACMPRRFALGFDPSNSQIRSACPASPLCCSPIAFAPRSIRNTDGGYSVTVRGEGFQRLGGSSQLGVAACEFRGSDDTGGDEVVTTRVTAIVSDRKLLCDGAAPPAASFHGPNSFTSRSANSSRLWALKLLHQAQIMRP